MKKEEESEEEDDAMVDANETGKSVKDDAVISSAEFRNWRTLCKANTSIIQTLIDLI